MDIDVEWPPGIRVTREEFLALKDEGHIWEYADGYAQDNLCGGIKGEISATLGYLIARVGRPQGIVTAGRCGWWMASGNLRVPNVTYTRRDRFPEGRIPDGFPEFAPDLAVEVLSPAWNGPYLFRKLADYFESGSQQVWLVEPNARSVLVYRGILDVQGYGPEDELTAGDLIPSFSCRVAEIFPD